MNLIKRMFLLLFFMNIVFLYSQDFVKSDIRLLKKIPIGSKSEQIGFGIPIAGKSSILRLIEIKNKNIVLFDELNNQICFYDLELNFTKVIFLNKSSMLVGASRVVMDEDDSIYILNIDDGLVKINNIGSDIFKIKINFLPENIRTSKNFFSHKGILYFYNNKGLIQLIDEYGNIKDEDYAKGKLLELAKNYKRNNLELISTKKYIIIDGFIRSNNIFENIRYIFLSYNYSMADIIEKYNDLQNLSVSKFIGYDLNNNSYWSSFFSNGDITYYYLYILSKQGNILVKRIYGTLEMINGEQQYSFKKYPTSNSSLAINENGDIFFFCPPEYIIWENEYGTYSYTLEENPGYRVFKLENTWDPEAKRLWQEKIDAQDSSSLKTLTTSSLLTEPKDKNAYHPVKLFDNNPKTMWIENAKGPGIGEKISFSFAKDITIDKITFQPGCFWDKYWKQNNRVKKIRMKLDGKNYTIDFDDEMKDQGITFNEPISFSEVELIIEAVYKTTKWDDTAISGIKFYLNGEEVIVDTSKFAEGFKVKK